VRAAVVPPPEVEASIAATIYHAFRLPLLQNTLARVIEGIDPGLPYVPAEGWHVSAYPTRSACDRIRHGGG